MVISLEAGYQSWSVECYSIHKQLVMVTLCTSLDMLSVTCDLHMQCPSVVVCMWNACIHTVLHVCSKRSYAFTCNKPQCACMYVCLILYLTESPLGNKLLWPCTLIVWFNDCVLRKSCQVTNQIITKVNPLPYCFSTCKLTFAKDKLAIHS